MRPGGRNLGVPLSEPNSGIGGIVVHGLPMANKSAGNLLVSVNELQATLGAEPVAGPLESCLYGQLQCAIKEQRGIFNWLATERY